MGAADAIVSPGESAGYQALVEHRLGREKAPKVLAVYYIPGMGHSGKEYDELIGMQLDAVEAWIDYSQSHGQRGAAAPASIGGYPRTLHPGARPCLALRGAGIACPSCDPRSLQRRLRLPRKGMRARSTIDQGHPRR